MKLTEAKQQEEDADTSQFCTCVPQSELQIFWSSSLSQKCIIPPLHVKHDYFLFQKIKLIPSHLTTIFHPIFVAAASLQLQPQRWSK